MKYFYLILTAVLWAVIGSLQPVQAKESDGLVLKYTLDTHTSPQLSLPVYNSGIYREARLWFLPDWQGAGTFKDRSQEGKGGDLRDYNCQTYGFENSCSWPMVSTGKVRPRQGLNCEISCVCDSSFKYNLANSPVERWILGLSTCGENASSRIPKPCAETYTAGLKNCNGKTYPAGWTYSSEGYSGEEVCGKCTAKECGKNDLTAGLENCKDYEHPEGWTYSSEGYAGDSVCGKCAAKECKIGWTPGLESCDGKTHSDGWTYDSDGYAGDEICGKCSALPCDEKNGFSSGLENCDSKDEPYYWKYDHKGYNGDAVCGRCTEMSCIEKNALCAGGTFNLDYYYTDGALRCLMK